jgi:muramoyltetrapeptide carboxypeptidase
MLKNKAGIPIAGPMLSDIPQSFKRNYAGLSLEKAILGDKKNFDISKYNRLEVIKSARSEGRVIAANLTVLCSLIGTKYMPDLRGCILLIEDINELDYKIHRSMSQLYFSGILNEINALLLGNFKNCGTRADMKIIFANFAKYVRGPIIYGLPFGHIKRILSLRLGTNTFVSDAGNVIFN